MGLSVVQKVGNFAFYSRILVFCMQVFFNYLIPDHDPHAFNPPSEHPKDSSDEWVVTLLNGFKRWDAVYFIHIAEHGYNYENTLAFFPLFPMVVRLVTNSLLFPLQYLMSYSSVLLISAVLLNFVCFIQAAKVLYLLSLRVLGDETLAFRAAQLFCINPASIFFSAAYSETSFALLSFSGMLQLECGRPLAAALFFGISGLCRSNGLVNTGFLLYYIFIEFARQIANLSKLSDRDNVYTRALFTVVKTCVSAVISLVMCFLPFVLYQFAAYRIFCNRKARAVDLKLHILNYGNENRYKMAHTGPSPWCYQSVPLSYSYVQTSHWDLGFLKYYEWKQLPNFLLAAPMVFICLAALQHYLKRNFVFFFTLGLHRPGEDSYKKTEEVTEDESQRKDYGFYSGRCYVYVVHMLFLVTTGCMFMHVQVITRFVASSCPVVYWFIAHITTPEDQFKPIGGAGSGDGGDSASPRGDGDKPEVPADDLLDWDNSGMFKQAILVYFHLYMFVGIAAFSNSLPWT